MDLTFSDQDEAFRTTVRDFLDVELTPELRKAGRAVSGIYADYDTANAWHRILARRGWSVPAWPEEFGGTGWSPTQLYIFECELAAADAPPISPNSTHMVAPVIIAFGTPEQKARYLPAIRSGDDWWAQGYSEAGAGSDLAALRCDARRDGDNYIINGSKTWTTHAHFSNRIFCLVRTGVMDRPQKGVSFLLFDLNLPGITVRPIRSISGEHELNEIFFDNVRVPVSALLGTEDEGWMVAKFLLQHERMHLWSPLVRARLNRITSRAASIRSGGIQLIDEPAFRQRLTELEIRLLALEIGELRALASDTGGMTPATLPSVIKILGTELRQAVNEFALWLDGAKTLRCGSANLRTSPGEIAMSTHLNDRAASIYAGTNEIQRDIVAKALLA